MATLQAEQIVDILRSSLNDLGRGKLTDLRSTRQHTHFARKLFKKGKVQFQSGPEVEFNLAIATNGSARGVGLYFTANVNPTNTLLKGKIDWRHATYNFAVEDFEIIANRSPSQIVNLLKERRDAALADWVVYCETRGWKYPSSTNTVDFMGIPYWVVKSTTAVTTNDGFNGTLPTGYTTVGNITPSDTGVSPKWNNYTDNYTTVNEADFCMRLERASDRTDFMPLLENPGHPDYNTGDDYGYYTTESVRRTLKDVLKAQNDNLGFDLDPVGGKMAFRRVPVEWVKELNDDTDAPFYGINWGVFNVAAMSGRWMKEIEIQRHPHQPTTSAVHFITTLNTLCYDRRRNLVLSTGASYDPSVS